MDKQASEPSQKGGALQGQRVACVGRLASMTHQEFANLVEDHAGLFAPKVNSLTTHLVLGQEGWPVQQDGQLNAKLREAKRLQQEGVSLEILSEEEFFELIGEGAHASPIHQLYTIAQLVRILGVPRDTLRNWIRLGLIQPSKVSNRLQYFDYSEVCSARSIVELISSGVAPKQIRDSLQSLAESFPVSDITLSQLSEAHSGQSMLFRLPDGGLSDAKGQLHFDFGTDQAAPEIEEPSTLQLVRADLSAKDWFERGLQQEQSGRLSEAIDAYHEALLIEGPQAEYCFCLANVLYESGEKQRAAERYRQAVELEPDYIEAWNNLGNAMADLEAPQKAIRAFERALQVEPGYADAHYNLAETYLQIGEVQKARRHFQEYLRLDPHSSWAQQVRRRLEQAN